jgi:hypothetical protein
MANRGKSSECPALLVTAAATQVILLCYEANAAAYSAIL